ncbi:SRPBCC family protein [Nocardioides dubius]|uniref:K(+)-transporting ATPase subunit F n=1 Tax=Nocardioides dubius TaxID=317019 RepID=A0ABN1U2B5_9ACTN
MPFLVERSITVVADPDQIRPWIEDFHRWRSWSPWEGLDPAMARTFSGPEHGVGASYAWSGNRKAGAGSMRITDSAPARLDVELTFLKPFKAVNQVTFLLAPVAAGTEITWQMRGEQNGLMKLLGKVFSMDKMVGKDFERGLRQLKETVEQSR